MSNILFILNVCQPIGHIKFHGGGIYGYEVFKELVKLEPSRVIAYVDSSKFLDPEIVSLLKSENISTIDSSCISLPKAVKENNVVVVYSPLYSSELDSILDLNVKVYLTIHGLRKLEMNRDPNECFYVQSFKDIVKVNVKRSFLYRFLFRKYYLQYASLLSHKNINIITVSNHSAASIRYFYPTLKNNIHVFYSPAKNIFDYNSVPIFSKEKYYLIISADRWLKNAYRTMQAFDQLFERNLLNCNVIVVGLSNNNSLIKHVKHKNRFIIMDYVETNKLESLFKSAYALVYPSLNEGFGYPPFEAMKYGTPVITSGLASLPEVCGDSVLYTNPFSIDEIAMRILQMEDETVYKSLADKSLKRYKIIHARQVADLGNMCKLLIKSIDE